MSLPLLQISYLDQLRGFVAVGRHRSMAKAAEELCLSPSAVSRQIKLLEERLGYPLVARHRRGVSLTPEGQRLFKVADVALLSLQAVLGELAEARAPRPVTISCSVGVAGLWLLPRLRALGDALPDVEVRVMTANRLIPDLQREGVDLAIRYAAREGVPDAARALFPEALAPVAHPSLGLPSRLDGELIRDQVLLEYDDPATPWLHWPAWLEASGLGPVTPRRVLRFNHYDQMIQTAMAGRGIALGRIPLVRHFIEQGALVRLGERVLEPSTGHAYWLLSAVAQPDGWAGLVADWLLAQAHATAAAIGALEGLRSTHV